MRAPAVAANERTDSSVRNGELGMVGMVLRTSRNVALKIVLRSGPSDLLML